MQYMLPRLTTFMTTGAGMEVRGGSGGGGGYLKGAGETQVEADKRLFRKQARRTSAAAHRPNDTRDRNTLHDATRAI